MDLDMHLKRQLIINDPIPKGCYIASDEIAYWSKAYAIDEWFKGHCEYLEDDWEYRVSEENLKELQGVCREILQKIKLVDGMVPTNGYDLINKQLIRRYIPGKTLNNLELAKTLLPDPENCYDECYYNNAKHTLKICTDAIRSTNFEVQELRYWSW